MICIRSKPLSRQSAEPSPLRTLNVQHHAAPIRPPPHSANFNLHSATILPQLPTVDGGIARRPYSDQETLLANSSKHYLRTLLPYIPCRDLPHDNIAAPYHGPSVIQAQSHPYKLVVLKSSHLTTKRPFCCKLLTVFSNVASIPILPTANIHTISGLPCPIGRAHPLHPVQRQPPRRQQSRTSTPHY